MVKTTFCNECYLNFGLAEKRVEHEGREYHEDCDQKRQRRDRIKALFIQNCANHGLRIVPHHPHGR